MKILVSFSGGKDSQACLIQAFKQYGGGNLTAVFCDTGWEHPDTYKHVNDVCLQMGVRLITLKSKYDFVSLAAHKKRFPSTNARFCTSELKMKPMIDYVLSLKESCIIIQGIRAGESTARAAMEEECMYFKSYFQPNKKGRTENYRSKDVKEWCSQYDASVLRPIFKWSAQQVIDCILDARLITDEIARLLARVKWIKRIRFGCDTPGQIAEVERASALIDKYGYKGEYFLYCILMDFKESFARVNYWKSKSRRFLPHCQPFRDLNNPHQIIPQWQKDMAHWADRKEIYMSCDFKDFSPRKGFLCKEYFKML